MANFRIVALFALGQLGEHRFRIDGAHELADILPLAHLRAMRRQAAQVAQCREKAVRQAQRLDFLVGQRRQLDAEFLKSRRFALPRALAQALLFSLASLACLAGLVEVARRHISHAISLGPVESWIRAPQTLSWR